jgi:hypothetical protein
MHRLTVAAALLAFVLAGPALAQFSSPGIQPGTQDVQSKAKKAERDEHNACFRDANRYCADAIPDDMKVLACLQDHRKKLSKGCVKLLEDNGQ